MNIIYNRYFTVCKVYNTYIIVVVAKRKRSQVSSSYGEGTILTKMVFPVLNEGRGMQPITCPYKTFSLFPSASWLCVP